MGPHTLYTVCDSFYRESRIFTLDIRRSPAVITDELVLRRGDETVDFDLEGIAQRPDGGFWAVSEGCRLGGRSGPTGEQHEPLDQDYA